MVGYQFKCFGEVDPKVTSIEPMSDSQVWRSFYDGSLSSYILETEWASNKTMSMCMLFLQHGIKVVILDRYLGRDLKLKPVCNLGGRSVKPSLKNIKALVGGTADYATQAGRLSAVRAMLSARSVTVKAHFDNPALAEVKYPLKNWVRDNVRAHSEDDIGHEQLRLASQMWAELGDPTDEDWKVLEGYISQYNARQMDADDLRSFNYRKEASYYYESDEAEIHTIDETDLANTFSKLYELERPVTPTERLVTIMTGWAYIKYGCSPTVLIEEELTHKGFQFIMSTPLR